MASHQRPATGGFFAFPAGRLLAKGTIRGQVKCPSSRGKSTQFSFLKWNGHLWTKMLEWRTNRQELGIPQINPLVGHIRYAAGFRIAIS
jgi:hypothetical protein